MAYQALYRTFRPATLGELVRQEHISRILANQIETGRIGHAYLFCGPRGTGKTSTAKIFAKAINCLNPKNGSPCGECEACRALADPSNLDVSEIDAASNNGVNEMRDLREKVQYPPVSCRYKVYIIDEVHMLSDSAFNALLKTLEEPPAHAVFILATTEPQKLPATILSRCMRFDFKLIPQKDIEAHLRAVFEKIGKEYEPEAVAAIARAGAGSMRDSLSVADMCVSYSKGKLTYADVNEVLGTADLDAMCELGGHLLAGRAADALAAAEKMFAAGKSAGKLAGDVLQFLSRCTVAKLCKNGNDILNLPAETYAEVERIAQASDERAVLRASEIFASVEADLRYSTAPRIVFETALVKASLPETDGDPAVLSRRIAALEKRVAQLSAGTPARQERTSDAAQEPFGASDAFVRQEEEPSPFDAPAYAAPRAARGAYASGASAGPAAKSAAESPAAKGKQAGGAPADRDRAFAYFIRALRTGGKNGVLFTMCQDLEWTWEGDTLVLITDNEIISRSLERPDHKQAVAAAMEQAGVPAYVVRLKGTEPDPREAGMEQLRRDFAGADIREK